MLLDDGECLLPTEGWSELIGEGHPAECRDVFPQRMIASARRKETAQLRQTRCHPGLRPTDPASRPTIRALVLQVLDLRLHPLHAITGPRVILVERQPFL